MEQIDLTYRTMYAELAQRRLDASFDAAFPMSGNFVRVPVKGRDYWYFEDRHADKTRRYVGLASDPEIARRVEAFGREKDLFRGRRKLVSTLVREARLTAPERLTGDIVEALERAGLFQLRAVLIGTVAFQTYAAYLGVRLPGAIMQTGDADFAQFHSIANAVEDSTPPLLEVLRSVDPTFRPIAYLGDEFRTTQYANAAGYKVEFLTPNRGSDELTSRPSRMPARNDTAALPTRFMDFLIFEPVRALLLHRDGIPVLVPAPERYAIHKLIVSSRRRADAMGIAKRDKDVQQARQLFEALAVSRQARELAETFVEAWERGTHWQEAIRRGLGYLDDRDREVAMTILSQALSAIGRQYGEFFPPKPAASALPGVRASS